MRTLLIAVSAAILLCASSAKATAEQDDWQAKLSDFLAFAELYEVELSIWKRCMAAFTEAYYGKVRATPFLDAVENWTRAKRDGKEGLAKVHYDLIIGDIKAALDVSSELERRQIADRDRHNFTRELEKDCRADGIRRLAGQ